MMGYDGRNGAAGGGFAQQTPQAAEELYAGAKISVWWDIENCPVPKGSDPHAIALNISSALVKLNYCGPVSISAYGDTTRISPFAQQALNSTGVALNHVPAGVKDASDKKILVDMLFWAVDNPAPASYVLISGDRDFSNALHQLRLRRYNILLAQPQQASAALVAAAKTVWLWTSLSAGEAPLSHCESKTFANNRNGGLSHCGTSAIQVSNASSSQLNHSSVDRVLESNIQQGHENYQSLNAQQGHWSSKQVHDRTEMFATQVLNKLITCNGNPYPPQNYCTAPVKRKPNVWTRQPTQPPPEHFSPPYPYVMAPMPVAHKNEKSMRKAKKLKKQMCQMSNTMNKKRKGHNCGGQPSKKNRRAAALRFFYCGESGHVNDDDCPPLKQDCQQWTPGPTRDVVSQAMGDGNYLDMDISRSPTPSVTHIAGGSSPDVASQAMGCGNFQNIGISGAPALSIARQTGVSSNTLILGGDSCGKCVHPKKDCQLSTAGPTREDASKAKGSGNNKDRGISEYSTSRFQTRFVARMMAGSALDFSSQVTGNVNCKDKGGKSAPLASSVTRMLEPKSTTMSITHMALAASNTPALVHDKPVTRLQTRKYTLTGNGDACSKPDTVTGQSNR